MRKDDTADQESPAIERKQSWANSFLIGTAASLVALLFVGLMGAGTTVLYLRAAAEAGPQRPLPTPVETLTVEMQDSYQETSRYVGRLEPARQTALAFERGGLVTSVFKDEGDRVVAGETIAQLDTAQLEATRDQLEAQERELKARRRLATLTLDRQSKLQKKGWSPEQRLDEAEASLGELTAGIDRVNAQISSIDIDIAKSNITAPFNGIVSIRSIDEGAVVAAGTPLLTVLEADRLQARIGLPPEVAVKLDPSRTYKLGTHAGELEARIDTKRPDLQAGTRTVTVLFDVSGESKVPFGEIVTLALDTRIKTRGTWVPLAALNEGHRGLWNVLTVVTRDGQQLAQNETVEILHIEAESAYVRGTFQPGAKIVAGGTNRVVTGQRVALAGG
ncbi:MAG: efflux RND transporter periplasmic adaptor subunit [Filomicrobium sp.]